MKVYIALALGYEDRELASTIGVSATEAGAWELIKSDVQEAFDDDPEYYAKWDSVDAYIAEAHSPWYRVDSADTDELQVNPVAELKSRIFAVIGDMVAGKNYDGLAEIESILNEE